MSRETSCARISSLQAITKHIRISRMHLVGSCHCQAVRFDLRSIHPYPFNLCYCSICRETTGGGGFAINMSGDYATLQVQGKKHISVYQVTIIDPDDGQSRKSTAQRHFCAHCASALWIWDPRWPELVHPYASAIDSPLPVPLERTQLKLEVKPDWVEPCRILGIASTTHIPRSQSLAGINDWTSPPPLEFR